MVSPLLKFINPLLFLMRLGGNGSSTFTVNLAMVLGSGRSNFLMAELFDYSERQRIYETLTCAEFVPRVRELEARGGAFWIIKVLKNNLGYSIQCDIPYDSHALKGLELQIRLESNRS